MPKQANPTRQSVQSLCRRPRYEKYKVSKKATPTSRTSRQNIVARQQVFQIAVAPHGDHVRVFEQQELIRDQPLLAISRELLLELQSARVIDSPELAQAAAMH